MGIPKLTPQERFTYADYKTWPENERWELIKGQAYAMSPAPNRRHQKFITNLSKFFSPFFDKKKCEVYYAPFDVLLPDLSLENNQNENQIDTVVQPDLLVVCDPNKLTDQGCTGAPDFVLEILSPVTAFKDMDEKLKLYEKHGVKEYWIVNPGNDTLMVYRRSTGPSFDKPLLFSRNETLEPVLFPGLTINLEEIFGCP